MTQIGIGSHCGQCSNHHQGDTWYAMSNVVVFQGDLQASIETSALQNQAIQERASHLEQNCDELVLAITGHCNALQTALKSFRSSCCNACDSEDAGTADSQAKLFASVNELLSFASTENLAEGQELAGSHGTAETRPQELPGVQGAADALQRLDVVMQNAGNVFTALADLNLHAQIQKREVHVQELGQRVMVGIPTNSLKLHIAIVLNVPKFLFMFSFLSQAEKILITSA